MKTPTTIKEFNAVVKILQERNKYNFKQMEQAQIDVFDDMITATREVLMHKTLSSHEQVRAFMLFADYAFAEHDLEIPLHVISGYFKTLKEQTQ